MLRPACVSLAAVIAIGALLSCDDGDAGATVFLPPRRSFDDGRELFFSKQGRDVKWLSWALDGRRFVYVDSVGMSDFRINVYDTATGEDRVLLEGLGSRVLWSPKGDYILFHESDYSYSIIKVDGTGRKRVIQGSFITNDYDANWSPDGNSIIWDAYGKPNYNSRNIYTLDLDTEEVTRISRDEWGDEQYPMWNPRGDVIAFYKTDTIFNWSSDWTTPVTLTGPAGSYYEVVWRGNDADSGVCRWLCDWSPKGRYILFAAVTETWGPGYWELWVLDVETRRFKQITSTADPNWWDYDGVFGPDGMVYFVVRNGRGDCKDIWRVDPKL
jgi:Tol biopolymer transport system component